MSAPNQPGPSSGGGSSVLAIVLIVGGVILLACAGICGGCLYVAGKGASAAKQSIEEGLKQMQLAAAYAATEAAVRENEQVKARLGEPVTTETPYQRQNTGDLKPAGETFQFDIKGPNGKAIVSAIATASGKDSPFKVTKITVTFADGSVVDVAPPSEQFDPTELKIDTGEPK